MTQIADSNPTTDNPPPAAPPANQTIDIVKRAVPRVLPCKLTDEEFVRISRTRVAKESERDQLIEDAKLDADKRKQQIKRYDDEINVMRRELHSGYQDRTIKTNEVFEKDAKGNCWIVVYRLDTTPPTPTGERHPASPAEMQRHLPQLETSSGTLLEQAAKAQRSAQPAETDAAAAVPEGLPTDADADAGDDEGDDDEDGDTDDSKPTRRRAKKGD